METSRNEKFSKEQREKIDSLLKEKGICIIERISGKRFIDMIVRDPDRFKCIIGNNSTKCIFDLEDVKKALIYGTPNGVDRDSNMIVISESTLSRFQKLMLKIARII